MTDKPIYNNDDDDITYAWTEAQFCLSKAFKDGLIDIRLREPDGLTIYRPLYLAFTSNGQITIMVDEESAEYPYRGMNKD